MKAIVGELAVLVGGRTLQKDRFTTNSDQSEQAAEKDKDKKSIFRKIRSCFSKPEEPERMNRIPLLSATAHHDDASIDQNQEPA